MTSVFENYIDGNFVPGSDNELIQVRNPSNGEILGTVPDASAATVELAVQAAHRAQASWARKPAVERARYLRSIAVKVSERRQQLAALITEEQGKTIGLAQVEVDFTADYIDYMAEWARRIEGEVITSDRPDETIFLLRKPIGVVVGILPWNFPFFLIARKLAPALVTGNTIVIKPSEETPLNAFEFAKLVDETDLPPGVFNLVSGRGRSTGAALTAHPKVNLISFTGSVETGSVIMQEAGKNLTRVNLELGGKAPAIVLADSDLDLAARAIFNSRIINSGQVCNCAERVYVERSVSEQFVSKITSLMQQLKIGDPSKDTSVELGPLVSAAQLAKVKAAVDTAKNEGARVVLGGKAADVGDGHFFEPTILVDCTADMQIMRKETFGPVLPIQIVDSLDEAIELANDSEYGLTSSIYTTNLNSAMQACHGLQFGETYINRENFEAMQGFHAGRRKSGIGGADGKYGLYEYMETQVVYMQHGLARETDCES